MPLVRGTAAWARQWQVHERCPYPGAVSGLGALAAWLPISRPYWLRPEWFWRLSAGDENKRAGSLEPTGLISQWDGADQVCGYCHGMVFAMAELEIAAGGHGVAYELPLGSKTQKRSSCLGRTTFLLAHGYQPSPAHLGDRIGDRRCRKIR